MTYRTYATLNSWIVYEMKLSHTITWRPSDSPWRAFDPSGRPSVQWAFVWQAFVRHSLYLQHLHPLRLSVIRNIPPGRFLSTHLLEGNSPPPQKKVSSFSPMINQYCHKLIHSKTTSFDFPTVHLGLVSCTENIIRHKMHNNWFKIEWHKNLLIF